MRYKTACAAGLMGAALKRPSEEKAVFPEML